MRLMRRHLRSGVATWLVCHVLSFSALLPRDCCAAHDHGAASHAAAAVVDHAAHGAVAIGHEHHTATPPADATGPSCPMRDAGGAPCPMHGGNASPESCQMTGVCNRPATALAAVLMQAAVPSAAFALLPRDVTAWSAPSVDEDPHTLFIPPDSPPPRL